MYVFELLSGGTRKVAVVEAGSTVVDVVASEVCEVVDDGLKVDDEVVVLVMVVCWAETNEVTARTITNTSDKTVIADKDERCIFVLLFVC